jgi:hypothetical protein
MRDNEATLLCLSYPIRTVFVSYKAGCKSSMADRKQNTERKSFRSLIRAASPKCGPTNSPHAAFKIDCAMSSSVNLSYQKLHQPI